VLRSRAMKSRLWLAGLLVGLAGACGDDAKPGTGGTGGSVAVDGGGGAGGSTTDAAAALDTGAGGTAGSDAAASDVAVADVAAADVSVADVPAGDGPAAVIDAPGIGMVALVADDKPGVAPCPGQTVLLDPAQLTALKVAMRDGVVSYLDVPFNAADPSIYKKKCGFEALFDPTKNTDVIPVSGAPKLAAVLLTGHGGICSDNFMAFGTDDGFPSAGVYRKEFRVAHMGATYHVRARVTALGAAAGQKFSANGIAVPGDIQNTLVYKLAGMTTAHDALWPAIANQLSSTGTTLPAVDLVVEKAGNALFQAKIELICAAKM
jgi:hypothetical protein